MTYETKRFKVGTCVKFVSTRNNSYPLLIKLNDRWDEPDSHARMIIQPETTGLVLDRVSLYRFDKNEHVVLVDDKILLVWYEDIVELKENA